MPPEQTSETRLAVLETEVANLKDSQKELSQDVRRLTEKLNSFMVKTALGTAAATAVVNGLIEVAKGVSS